MSSFDVDVLVSATKSAGSFLAQNAFSNEGLEWKGFDNPVTYLDKTAEMIIRESVSSKMPANFIGEEFGFEDNGSDFTFIIDPLDGTKPFIRKEFSSVVSVGVEEKGVLIAGAIYDFMRDILYLGFQGKNSTFFRGEEVFYSFDGNNSNPVLCVDGDGVSAIGLFGSKEYSVKRPGGGIALLMAQTSFGCFDALIQKGTEWKGGVWDVAAGVVLLKNAGFKVMNYLGEDFDYRSPFKGLIALNPARFGELNALVFESGKITFK